MTGSLAVSLLLLPSLLFAQAEPNGRRKSLAITRVTVIDATGAPAMPGMTVVISGERIVALGKSEVIKPPGDAEVVEAAGKFIIPGLWDLHVHWYDKSSLSLFTANGVTGVRQMSGAPVHLLWRKEIADGSLPGPRMIFGSRIVDGPKPMWPTSITVTSEEEGRQAVLTAQREGYDFVKVYSLLPRGAYFGIAAEARKQMIPFAGHVPFSVSASEASEAGQKSLEHLDGLLLACSSQETELRQQCLDLLKPGAFDPAPIRRFEYEKILGSYDTKVAAALFARFARNHTWQVPTLTVNRSMAHLDDEGLTKDTRLKYMPRTLREAWNPKNDFRFKNYTKEDFARRRAVFQKHLELVRTMHRAGVEILAGTDTGNPYCFPGFGLHDELKLLVEAGLTPIEALQAATRNPAKFLQKQKDFGTVEEGRIADLVLLEEDPLGDIANTKKIAAVVIGGNLLTKEALRVMLAEVEAAANSK